MFRDENIYLDMKVNLNIDKSLYVHALVLSLSKSD